MADSIGTLAAVPWDAQDMLQEDKISEFINGYHNFSSIIADERTMSSMYFAFATAQLWRLIVQTKAHTRTAVLVHTVAMAMDDLW